MRVEYTYIHECEKSYNYDCRLPFKEKNLPYRPVNWQVWSANVSTHLFERIINCPYCGVNLNEELLAWKRDIGV